jgi:hypothetical protein
LCFCCWSADGQQVDKHYRTKPLRSTTAADVYSGVSVSRAHRQFSSLMGMIESKLKDSSQWVEDPTMDQILNMFELGKAALAISTTTQTGAKRSRPSQLSWRTVYNEVTKQTRVDHRLAALPARAEPIDQRAAQPAVQPLATSAGKPIFCFACLCAPTGLFPVYVNLGSFSAASESIFLL